MESLEEYTLGLDLGSASVGWAVIETAGGVEKRIVAAGSRVFDAGVDGQIEEGKDESRNVERRLARQRRRQTERRSERQKWAAVALQDAGLLPEGAIKDPATRHEMLLDLDKALRAQYADTGGVAIEQLPYFLRARALDHPLSKYELGRAFYHLAQRRGFLSNRKTAEKEDEDAGKVKEGIRDLDGKIKEAGARTLGEYFAGLDPQEQRIRGRYTHRSMFTAEFKRIWEAQAPHHRDVLAEDFRETLHRVLFYQRPLKSQKHLIGQCNLELGRPRAPWALPCAQRFRMLQRLNDLEVIEPETRSHRRLTPEERAKALALLESQAELSLAKLRSALKLKGTTFNFDVGGDKIDKILEGDQVGARLRGIFGDRWDTLSQEEKEDVITDLRSIREVETLKRRGVKRWGLTDDQANGFSRLKLKPGYCAHSRQAIESMLPYMEEGLRYIEARDKAYPASLRILQPHDLLPPIRDKKGNYLPSMSVRNPTVIRSLSELRKVVNAVIRSYGKPALIRLELARDLKRPKDLREKIWKANEKRRKERDKAAAAIRDRSDGRIQHPKRQDIEKYLLAEECGWQCPYTGQSIGFAALFGDSPQFDVEHIIPFSRCLDDSFLNKTLCYHEYNRAQKGNKTPRECAGDSEFADMLTRVRSFKGDAMQKKLERFMTEKVDTDAWTSRALNDTRYASTQAMQYLAWLYGKEWRKHIQVNTGQVTAFLRDVWRLNAILGDGSRKSRDDHRHHAVDAIAIALAGPRAVQMLSKAAEQNKAQKGRFKGWWKLAQEPWVGFFEEVKRTVDGIVVSHRVNHKVSGPLHEETNYGRPRTDEKGKSILHIRKAIGALSDKDVANIADKAVREAVLARLDALGERDPKKAFKDEASLPYLTAKDGRRIPIRRVRIAMSANVTRIGKDNRHVKTGSNHHAEIVETTNKKGEVVWEEHVVSLFEAMQRRRRGEPVIKRDHGEGKRFVMSLAPGDTIEIDDNGGRILCLLNGVSEGFYEFRRLSDARMKKEIMQMKERMYIQSMSKMMRVNLRKVVVSPVGKVFPAND